MGAAQPILRTEGTLTLFSHCIFRWTEFIVGGPRVAVVEYPHCDRCVDHLRRLGFLLDDRRELTESRAG